MVRTALVLGAGGESGTAWTAGVLACFHDAGIERLPVDLVMGTSGGAVAAAFVAADLPLGEFYRAEMRAAEVRATTGRQIAPEEGKRVEQVIGVLMGAIGGLTDSYAIRRRVGELAADAQTIPEAEFRTKMGAYLPFDSWPTRRFAPVAVDIFTGEPHLLDKESGFDVAGAVAAACAVPMICPPVRAGQGAFIDAGIRSNENLDLAMDFDQILVVSPRGILCPQGFGGKSLEEELEEVRKAGSEVNVVEPDGRMLDLICEHMLDSEESVPILQAGREHGRRVADYAASLTSADRND